MTLMVVHLSDLIIILVEYGSILLEFKLQYCSKLILKSLTLIMTNLLVSYLRQMLMMAMSLVILNQ